MRRVVDLCETYERPVADWKTARRLLESCGYSSVRARMTVIPVELLFGSPRALIGLLRRLLIGFTVLLPGLLGYQTFLVAQRRAR